MENINKFETHKSILNILENEYLKLFEDFITKNNDSIFLECSCKKERGSFFGSRFNFWYTDKEHIKNLNNTINFFKAFCGDEAVVNYGLLNKILNIGVDLNETNKVIGGIDLRDNFQDSRVKLWLEINKKDKETIKNIFRNIDYNEEYLKLLKESSNKFLFGFDFWLNGESNIKTYYWFDEKDLIKDTFEGKIKKLVKECHIVHISFNSKELEKTIHFHPKDINSFVDKINSEELKEMINKVIKIDKKTTVISLKEKEIENNKIESFNLYY